MTHMEHARLPRIVFLFIGGAHQVYHLAPVAAELSRYGAVEVQCIYADAATGAALAAVRDTLGATRLTMVRVDVPGWAGWLAQRLHRHAVTKVPLLIRLIPRLRRAAAIVTPERTSAVLRRLGVLRPLLVHFRHGAGDRAPKSERRLAKFDLVVVPGEKDVLRARRVLSNYAVFRWFGVGNPLLINFSHGAGDRAVESEKQLRHFDYVVVAAEKDAIRARVGAPDPAARILCGGYVKLDYLARLGAAGVPLFDNGRPTVIYNPHFDASVSSWPQARAVVAAFAAQDRYNLVVAPHIRLSQDLGPEAVRDWQQLSVPGRIIVDLESPRLIDMTYVGAADVYLGDVSSQLYEFLSMPRPAAFLNAHGVDWAGDSRYAGWHLGTVADRVEDVVAAVDRARAEHPGLAERQRAAVIEAFGDYDGASVRGAAIVAAALGLAPVAEPMLT